MAAVRVFCLEIEDLGELIHGLMAVHDQADIQRLLRILPAGFNLWVAVEEVGEGAKAVSLLAHLVLLVPW